MQPIELCQSTLADSMSSTELEALSNRVDNENFEGVQYMVRYNSMADFQSSLVIPLVQRQMSGLSVA
jgi:hypothetical protein